MLIASTPPSSVCQGNFYSSELLIVSVPHVCCHTWLLIYFAFWFVSPVISWGSSACCYVRRFHQCWICSSLKSSWWRRPASVSEPLAFSSIHMQAVVLFTIQLNINIIKLTWCNTFLSPQNKRAHAQFLQAHSWCWKFSQLCKSLFSLMYILPKLTLRQSPPFLIIGLLPGKSHRERRGFQDQLFAQAYRD